MDNKPKSKCKYWKIAILVAALAVAYVALVFLPTRRAIAKLTDDLEAKRAFITQGGSLAAALETTGKLLEKTREYDAKWEENAPSQSEFYALFGRIHDMAKASGATTNRFDPEPAVEYNTLLKVPLVVGCTGTFPQIFDFLRSLDSLSEEVWVEEIRLEKLDATGKSIECSVTLGVFADNPENSDQGKQSG